VALELIAPAKLNLTLEVLGKREDGYHEVVSLMQTIDLGDKVVLESAPTFELRLDGDVAGVPDGESNLVYRAVQALEAATGTELGARITITKRIPAGFGMGGGSTDAATALRGLVKLHNLKLSQSELGAVAASIGSDVTFFLHGGTALATGRGEVIEPLPDMPPQDLTLFTSHEDIADKTRRMYAQITPADFSDASLTQRAVEVMRAGEPLTWWETGNAFDRHLKALAPRSAAAMRACTQAGVGVVATGAGPAFFSLMALPEMPEALLEKLRGEFGVTARAVRTLSRAESLAVREV